jgi:hypothetical protein
VMPPLLVLAPGLLLITAMVVTGSTTEKSKV